LAAAAGRARTDFDLASGPGRIRGHVRQVGGQRPGGYRGRSNATRLMGWKYRLLMRFLPSAREGSRHPLRGLALLATLGKRRRSHAERRGPRGRFIRPRSLVQVQSPLLAPKSFAERELIAPPRVKCSRFHEVSDAADTRTSAVAARRPLAVVVGGHS